MAQHQFTVTVDADTAEQAEQVMAERIYHDEDYGFDYTINFAPASQPLALAVDDGENVQVMVLQSMDEVYSVLRENYAQDEDIADDDLIEHLQSQGTLVYVG